MIERALAVMGCTAILGLAVFTASVQGQGSPEAKALVQNRCTVCHNLTRVRDHIGKNDRNAWDTYVTRMQKNGAQITAPEKQAIVDYLSSLKSGKDL